MSYFDEDTGERFIPYVIEPAAGVDRGALAFLLDAYAEDEAPDAKGKLEKRTVLRLDRRLAPVKAAVLPLSRNADLSPKARDLAAALRKRWNTDFDDASAIGRRYRRQDEIGTPYCVTVDFDTVDGSGRHGPRPRHHAAGAGRPRQPSRPTYPSASAPADVSALRSAPRAARPGPRPAERGRNLGCGPVNPSGSPAADIAAAISSISATQRQPLAAADPAAATDRSSRPGWEMPHSASRVSGSTPSARASARAASSRAAVPLVQDAYAIFTADAAPTPAPARSTTRADTAVPSNSARTSPARGPDR